MQQYIDYTKHIGGDEYLLKWVSTVLKNELAREAKTTEEVEHILDFLVQYKKKVQRMSYKDAKRLSDAWMKTQIKKGNNIVELPTDTEVVLDFNDGFKIVKLISENAYKREGFLMSHCVASYYGNGKEIYSLRDKDNVPHCTMEKDQQIKGKGNGDIHHKYINYVVKFLEHVGMTVGDSEMKHLGYINLDTLVKELEIELHDDTKALMYKGYYPTSKGIDGLKDSENKPIRTLELLDYFPMFDEVEEDNGFKLKLALDIPMLASGFVEFVKNKVSKKKSIKEKIFGIGKDSELISAGNDAKVSAGNDAKVSAEDNATVSAEDDAKVSVGNYATVSAGYNATVSAGYNAKVSAGNYAKVSAEDDAKVSVGNYATVSAGYNAKVSAGYYAKVSAGNDAKVSAGNYAKVSAEDDAKVSAGNYAKVSAEDDAKVSVGNYATVSAGYNATVSAGDYATVSAGYNAKVSAGNYTTVSAEDDAKVSVGNYATVSAGKDSILVSETDSKMSGDIGTILLITKREYKNDRYQIVDWKAEMVDGKKIKVNTFYKLENGKLIEAK